MKYQTFMNRLWCVCVWRITISEHWDMHTTLKSCILSRYILNILQCINYRISLQCSLFQISILIHLNAIMSVSNIKTGEKIHESSQALGGITLYFFMFPMIDQGR